MTGRYRAYPEYKDSGVEWVGMIPKNWHASPLKRLCQIDNSGFYGDEMGSRANDIPVATTAQIDKDGRFHVERMPVRSFSSSEKKKYLCQNGEIIVVKSSGSADNIISGKAGYIDAETPPFIFSNFLLRLKPFKKKAFHKYLYYFVTSHLTVERIKRMVSATTYPNLQVENYISAYVIHPQCIEQQQIAAFLDHETAKIDTLIEKQQKLIALLKEKRQAVISHAVTKGLNPDAQMKDSGVEWLGEVPAHWGVIKFSHCTSIRNGQVDPTNEPYCDFVLIAPNHIESKTGRLLSIETAAQQGADSGKYLCKKGEVIYSKIRPALTKVCISPSDGTICSADMYPIKAMHGLTNKFLYWLLLSDWFTCLTILESDRVAMPKINREKLAEVKLPVPSSKEQLQISLHILEKTQTLDSLIEKAIESIDLSKERRTALISAAVTGKIDVRDWQPPPTHKETI